MLSRMSYGPSLIDERGREGDNSLSIALYRVEI